jgi:hypothetical protein
MNFSKFFVVGIITVVAGVFLGTLLQPSSSPAAQESAPGTKAPVLPARITSGPLISVKVWEHPPETSKYATNHGQTLKGGRVDIYDRFIILTQPDGDRTLVAHGYYTELWFKSE